MDQSSARRRAADIPAITAIYADAVLTGTASFEIEPPDEAEMMRRDDAARSRAAIPIWSPNGDGAVLGYAYAGPYRTRPAYRHTVEDSIYLAAEARGQGHRRGAARGADRRMRRPASAR